jgi:hypothetical protein
MCYYSEMIITSNQHTTCLTTQVEQACEPEWKQHIQVLGLKYQMDKRPKRKQAQTGSASNGSIQLK